jgi:hypothetical protein
MLSKYYPSELYPQPSYPVILETLKLYPFYSFK